MWTHRGYYVLALALSALFYVLYPHWFAWYFLVVLLLLLPFDLLISLPGMLTRSAILSVPNIMEQNEPAALAVHVKKKSIFPSGALKARLHVKNEGQTASRRIRRIGVRGGRPDYKIDTTHCGVTSFQLKNLWVTSLIGFFSLPIPARTGASAGISATVLVLPTPVQPPRAILLPQVVNLRPKPGGGYAEEHDLRPYRDGDPVNSVHWKLTAKHDSLIVREPLEPFPHKRLVIASEWDTPDGRDLVLGRLRWVSEYLSEKDLPHYVKIGDRSPAIEITRPGDFATCLNYALGAPVKDLPARSALPGRFTWVFAVDGDSVRSQE
ncbi:MAG: DUF58 domain-containing protein [Oscillospiraceae bacterium]|jgi:uncharacterized protein (DUF58 family)|nr:DUF58 domain-containing protein [Oscillospiraceae bacterium]